MCVWMRMMWRVGVQRRTVCDYRGVPWTAKETTESDCIVPSVNSYKVPLVTILRSMFDGGNHRKVESKGQW